MTTELTAQYSPLPWEFSTANGRLPIVRELRQPHGEASRHESVIRSVSGEFVCRLDFGYGKKSDEATARLILSAVNSHADLLAALKAIDVILDAVTIATENGVELVGPSVRDVLEAGAVIKDAIAKAETR